MTKLNWNKRAKAMVPDLKNTLASWGFDLLSDDGMTVLRMDDADAFYVCFRPVEFKNPVWPPLKDE